ncbi:hypothetical protein [Epilithonimonas xixisoli]|nr:hypothetical protein [Epilithonimonas xixisoli]
MMKIERPELFYLFRRAFGLFFLFAVNIFSYAQITAIGNVKIIDNSNISPTYITSGTYVFDSGKTTFKKKALSKKFRKITSKANKKVKFPIASKLKAKKYRFDYQYFPKEDADTFFSTPTAKTTCPNTNNLNYKFSHLLTNWTLVQTFLKSGEKTTPSTSDYNLSYHLNSQRVRPPPYII